MFYEMIIDKICLNVNRKFLSMVNYNRVMGNELDVRRKTQESS